MVLPLDDSLTSISSDNVTRQAVIRTEIENLIAELEGFKKFRDYYEGDQKLVFGTDKFQEVFGSAFEGFLDNWCPPVIGAVQNKLVIQGFNITGSVIESDDSDDADSDANTAITKKIWETAVRNDIDEQSDDVHNGALVESRSAMLVWPTGPTEKYLGTARLDWQPADLIRVRYDDDDYRKALWAIKRWSTPNGEVRVNVYYPNRLEKYTQAGGDTQDPEAFGQRRNIPNAPPMANLERRLVEGESWPLKNPFGEIPIVEFNNPRGSELRDVIPQQDAINKVIVDMMIAGEYQAILLVLEVPDRWRHRMILHHR